jgi:hypothetical protein
MKDIWVRFWDGDTMHVYHIETLMLREFPSNWVEPWPSEPNEQKVIEKLVAMRCGDMDDKLGTLIFEGDIVKTAYETLEIKYENGIVGYKHEETGCFDTLYNLVHEFEILIIGNIYQNPELLEKINHPVNGSVSR